MLGGTLFSAVLGVGLFRLLHCHPALWAAVAPGASSAVVGTLIAAAAAAAVAQRLHETIHELLGRKVEHPSLRMPQGHVMGDRVHQMRLAQTDTAIEEQRIEGHRPALGNATGRGMGQFVRLADDKRVEGEPRIKRGA